jgi:hypothetical protein
VYIYIVTYTSIYVCVYSFIYLLADYPALSGYLFIRIFYLFSWNRSRRSRVMSLWYYPPQILRWSKTQKCRYFTVMWHRDWSGRFTYLNRNGCMFVCMFQHNTHYRAVAWIPICVSVTSVAIGNTGGGGVDPMEASHTILQRRLMLRSVGISHKSVRVRVTQTSSLRESWRLANQRAEQQRRAALGRVRLAGRL